MKTISRWLMLPACLAASSGAFAQATSNDANTGSGFGLGIASIVRNEAYKGVGTKTHYLPLLTYESDRFKLEGTQASVRVFGGKDLQLALQADYRFDGFDPDDSPYLAGLTERKGTLMMGVGLRYATPHGVLSASVGRGVNASKGTRGEVGYTYPVRTGAITITPKLSVEVLDAKYVNHYVGVAQSEARLDRPAYSGKRTLNVEGGLEVSYDIDGHQRLLAMAQHRRFGNEIANSPLLEKRNTSAAGIAYVYRF